MLGPDFRDLLSAFSDADARFMVIGGYAVGIHGRPRATKDLDVWVEASASNAPKVLRALQAFGAPLFGLTEADFKRPGVVLQIGLPPNRIDITTKIDGVAFSRAWPRRIQVQLDEGLVCPVIGIRDLLTNKRASGRPQDLADVDALERLDVARKGSSERARLKPTAARRAKRTTRGGQERP